MGGNAACSGENKECSWWVGKRENGQKSGQRGKAGTGATSKVLQITIKTWVLTQSEMEKPLQGLSRVMI